jgi:hypothetical protein
MTLRLNRTPPGRAPEFLAGVIAEPTLLFGGNHEHVDPKTGLALYGPHCPAGLARPALSSMIVGAVGPPAMIADAAAWIEACTGMVTNAGDQPLLYPHFPGCRRDSAPFYCDLVFQQQWCDTIRETDLKRALAKPIFEERLAAVIDMYLAGIETLSQREPTPSVVLICLSQEVVDRCAHAAPGDQRVPVKRPVRRRGSGPQLDFFAQLGIGESDEDSVPVHRNLRRGLKARAMRYGLPTQIVWPRTMRLTLDGEGRVRGSQDAATRAWNFSTGLYYKSGGVPWRLTHVDSGVCFVGVSFYRETSAAGAKLRTSMAQTFTSNGDGFVLRGSTFDWDEASQGRSPHLDAAAAQALIRGVLDLYKRQNRGSLPTRLVVHKRSRFWDDELKGFQNGAEQVPLSDFVAVGQRGIRFFRPGDFRPLRGTYVKFSDHDFVLYTTGFVPFLRTYPGARIPQPTEVLEHFGDSPWNTVLSELLAMTKLNWNTADFAARDPITIAFSNRVGEILAEIPDDAPIRQEYRFYM